VSKPKKFVGAKTIRPLDFDYPSVTFNYPSVTIRASEIKGLFPSPATLAPSFRARVFVNPDFDPMKTRVSTPARDSSICEFLVSYEQTD
jgi:hypothetical protein